MKKTLFLLILFSVMALKPGFSQTTDQVSTQRRFYIGSTFFMLGNLSSENRPDFAQLNVGYRMSPTHSKNWKVNGRTIFFLNPVCILE